MYLSTVLDDYSRYIIAWKLCSTMRAEDVTDTLDMALAASGCDQAHVHHKPRLLSDNGPRVWTHLIQHLMAKRCSMARKFCACFSKRVDNLRISFILQKKRSTILRMA